MATRTIKRVCVGSLCVAMPHRQNRYRPYALRHSVLAGISMLLILAKVSSILLTALAPQTAYLATISPSHIVQLVNGSRAEGGLSPLSINPKLTESARLKAQDMFTHNYFAHVSPQGVTPWKWFDDVAYAYVYAGENLAIDFHTNESVHQAWMNSPSHRDNIMNDRYREIGIAAVTGTFDGRTTTIIVQHFGSVASEPVPAVQPEQPEQPSPPEPEPLTTPTPLPPPTILEPEEGTILPNAAATVRGESIPESEVHLFIDREEIGTYLAPDGTFSGTFTPPPDTEKESTLTARTVLGSQISPFSSPRNIFIATRTPSVASEEAVFLPDPSGDITSLLLVVPVSGNVKSAFAEIGITQVPFEVQGNVASARVKKQVLGKEFTVHTSDAYGNTGTASLQPLRVFHETPHAKQEADTHKLLQAIIAQLQLVASWIVMIIAFVLTLTILSNFRTRNADIVAHAIFVITLGATLLVIT